MLGQRGSGPHPEAPKPLAGRPQSDGARRGTRYHLSMRIRPAERGDLESIRAIYNAEVAESLVTFDIVPWTVGRPGGWLDRHQGAHPAVVAVDGAGPRRRADRRPRRGRARVRLAVALPRTARVRHHRRELGLRGPDRSPGVGSGRALLEELDPAGQRARVPHRSSPAPRAPTPPRPTCTLPADSRWWGSNARSAASTAGGSTWSSSSGCSDRQTRSKTASLALEELTSQVGVAPLVRTRPTRQRHGVDQRPSGDQKHAQQDDQRATRPTGGRNGSAGRAGSGRRSGR